MFSLERSERAVILLLICALLLGTGIIVYRKAHSAADVRMGTFDSGPAAIADGSAAKVNINDADMGALMRLQGVGKVLAARIIAYRDANGPFISAEELKKVKGIGRALFDRIKDGISAE